jgi:flagellin
MRARLRHRSDKPKKASDARIFVARPAGRKRNPRDRQVRFLSLGVLNNINAIYAENNLNATSASLAKVMQQLSSGSKISSGADDAAGLALIDGLQANSQALAQSQINIAEGVGLLSVADGALSQVTNLLNRAVTLATEASNGTLNKAQNTAANQEYQSILSEISNIGSTTTYNNQAVFGTNTSIFAGDSSLPGSTIDALSLRALSSSNLGDSGGTMGYSTGAKNVFIDLSKGGVNAAVTDSLGTAAETTTIAVNYLTSGATGASVNATANITVGAGTAYANTAQGLINAVNNAGLGITASFGTASLAGSASVATAIAANEVNSSLQISGSDTGIILSGAGVGISAGTGAGGSTGTAGSAGVLAVAAGDDLLGGSLTVTGSSGASHVVNLGTVGSTDTLANLATTINQSADGITASINSSSVTNASGTFAAGTVLTFTASSSAIMLSGTGITDTQVAAPQITFTGGAGNGTAGSAVASMSVNAASDALSGEVAITPGSSVTAGLPAATYNLNGQTLAQFAATFSAGGANAGAGITAQLNAAATAVTFTESAIDTQTNPALASIMGSTLLDNRATAGGQIAQPVAVNAGSTGTFGTVTLTNASDALTAGSIVVVGGTGVNTTFQLGTSGSTDNLTDLAVAINSWSTTNTAGVSASVNAQGTQLSLAATTAGTYVPTLQQATAISTTTALTGAPVSAGANSTVMGTLALPAGQTSAAGLGGTLTLGTESIQLGVAATSSTPGTATMAELAQTINAGKYGITAALNASGTGITLSSADSANASVTPNVTATEDTSDGNANLTWSAFNQGVTTQQAYSLGISGTVLDSTTGGGTATTGLSLNSDGSGGMATLSYSDAAGQSLANTDLATQSDSQATLTALNKAIGDVAAQDGYIGAQINTLNSMDAVLSTQQTNVIAALNAVQATDYASATSAMAKFQILTQTGISALAQANTMQQEITKLLQ